MDCSRKKERKDLLEEFMNLTSDIRLQISFTCSLPLCLNLRYLGIRDFSVKVNTKMDTNG